MQTGLGKPKYNFKAILYNVWEYFENIPKYFSIYFVGQTQNKKLPAVSDRLTDSASFAKVCILFQHHVLNFYDASENTVTHCFWSRACHTARNTQWKAGIAPLRITVYPTYRVKYFIKRHKIGCVAQLKMEHQSSKRASIYLVFSQTRRYSFGV